ncbi:hypothetical protein [Sphingomonas sp. PB4P5]|uniref:hypothetical protein n=1 Tax=Parasphingomonas puruogangriensis TaxID=3096155 RepID=UPI002FCA718C
MALGWFSAAMASFKYTLMPRDETYTVHRDGIDIGMVWRAGDQWHADLFGMHAPQISAATREAAAAMLPANPF